MEPQHHLLADRVDDPGTDLGGSQFVFGLGLEDRVLDLDGHGADEAVPDVFSGKTVLGKLVDSLEDPFAKRALMGAAVVGVLAVDEAEIGFAVGVGVGEGEFESALGVVDGVVDAGSDPISWSRRSASPDLLLNFCPL